MDWTSITKDNDVTDDYFLDDIKFDEESLPFSTNINIDEETEEMLLSLPIVECQFMTDALDDEYQRLDFTHLSLEEYNSYVLRSMYYNYYVQNSLNNISIPDKWNGIDMSVVFRYKTNEWDRNYVGAIITLLKSTITEKSNVVFQSEESLHMTLFHSFRTNMLDEFDRVIPYLDMNRWQHVKIDLINLFTNLTSFHITFKKIIITDTGAILLCGYPIEDDISDLQMLRNKIKNIHTKHGLFTKPVNNIFHITIGKILPKTFYKEYDITENDHKALTSKIVNINKELNIKWNPSTVSIVGSNSPILNSVFTEVKMNLKYIQKNKDTCKI